MDLAVLVLRLVVGLTMAAHGAQKLFGWFNGPGLSGTAGFYESLGFRPGKAHARMSVMAEFGGGLALAAGFLTPLAAAGILGSMAAAIATFHWAKGFFNEQGGYEFNLLLAVTAFAITIAGPGAASVDSVLGLNLAGVGWALAALAFGAATAAGVMSKRKLQAQAASPDGSDSEEEVSQAA